MHGTTVKRKSIKFSLSSIVLYSQRCAGTRAKYSGNECIHLLLIYADVVNLLGENGSPYEIETWSHRKSD
jgi:hypothetical protein